MLVWSRPTTATAFIVSCRGPCSSNFLPLDGDDTLLADELAPGQLYELVVTTLGGLCRYRIGDVVEFVKYHEGHAPVVRFRYRAGQVLNVRGEKTSEEVLQRAVDVALGNVDFAAFECHDDAAAPGYDVVAAMDWDPGRLGAPRRRPAESVARLRQLAHQGRHRADARHPGVAGGV